ncbi:TIM-barrel domain-containing protein [Flagellimonas aurea]|uniref:TIM-barrel domain-containing protein n=1 Tax=Flagellimonas aurea TaxID=2915619 RepID=UPI0035CEAF8E
MRTIGLTFILTLVGVLVLHGQSSFMTSDSVAVFYPARFDAAQHLPSFAVERQLERAGDVPDTWSVAPVFTQTDSTSTVRIAIGEGVDLYGNGEVTGDLRRNNTETVLWNTDNYEYKKHEGKRLYQSHPWILGVRPDGTAFGVLADNSWKQEFDLHGGIAIKSYSAPFRVLVVDAPSPQRVMEKLGDLIGTIPMPPLWSLGYQQSRFSYYPADSVRYIAKEFRKRKIPADVLWMDIDYMDGYRIFTFDPEGFPDPKKLNKDLHALDFKSIYMIDPGVKVDSTYGIYQQGSRGNHWVLDADGEPFVGEVWPGDCVFPDYTRPETREWWSGLYPDFMDLGIDGVWNDMNEPAVFDRESFTIPENGLHRGGGALPASIHRRYHNVYGLLMVKASREGILSADPDKRPFVLSRANFLGGQRYAATWTGDNHSSWEYLKMSIPMSLNLSLSGQPFNGPDIGGFTKNSDAELLGHWMAMGAYFPFFRNHSSKNTTAQEPWAFGRKIEDVSRTAINRRYRLLPYLYTLFREAHETGAPIMKPTFFADIQDTSLRDQQETFLLGDHLLIVPRWAENVQLPKGNWTDIAFEKGDDGYQAKVKLRPGAIVPMTDKVFQSTEDYSNDRIVLLINPDDKGKARGHMYSDAGQGYGYQNGAYALNSFSAELTDKTLKVTVQLDWGVEPNHREYRIGYVKQGEIVYSEWTTGNEIILQL